MKKFLPLILLGLGIVVVIAAFFIFKGNKKTGEESQEPEIAPEVAFSNRPVASLTPTSDGHWLNLTIEKIKIQDAQTMDYELLYQLPDGRTQGVPGTITLSGQDKIERKLLLGSESSGKFRYDEGVKEGTLTLRFRNSKGKLVAKFSTKLSLLSDTKDLTFADGKFEVSLNTLPKKTFFVLMETFGVPTDPPIQVDSGPYGIFSSSTTKLAGVIKIGTDSVYRYVTETGNWTALTEGADSFQSGIFIGTSK